MLVAAFVVFVFFTIVLLAKGVRIIQQSEEMIIEKLM